MWKDFWENIKMANQTNNFTWPTIDVVIPTLNCEDNLKLCLERIRVQKYDGKINILIIDGGSKDGTLKIADKFNCTIDVIPGIYSTGNNGAKMIGEKKGKSEFIWHIDSDNFLVGEYVAIKLIEPMVKFQDVNISVPYNQSLPIDDQKSSKLSKALNYAINKIELDNLNSVIRRGKREGNCYFISDLDIGITNASLLRRSAEVSVGFYDSDVELLKRLRKAGLAKAVIVTDAFFEQYAVDSFMGYVRKYKRRLKYFANLGPKGLRDYFVDSENIAQHFSINSRFYINRIKNFLKNRKLEDLAFISLLLASILIVIYSLPDVILLKLRTKGKP